MRAAVLIAALSLGCSVEPPPPELAAPPWFQLDDADPASDALTGYRLRVGRVGEAERVDEILPPESFVTGPIADTLVIGRNDGKRSRIELLDVSSGERRTVVESPDVLRRATLDPSGTALFVFALAHDTRDEIGTFRFDLGSDRAVRSLEDGALLLGPLPIAPEEELTIGRTFATTLHVTDDAGALVVQSCGEILCRARIVDLDTGAVTNRFELGQGELLGLDGRTLYTYEAGNGWPCNVLAIDLGTGDAHRVAFAYGAALVRDAEGHGTLVYESGAERGTIYTVQRGAAPRLLATLEVGAEDDIEVVSIAQRSLSGLALPDGLVALGAGGRVAATGGAPGALVARLDDGALFQLAGGVR